MSTGGPSQFGLKSLFWLVCAAAIWSTVLTLAWAPGVPISILVIATWLALSAVLVSIRRWPNVWIGLLCGMMIGLVCYVRASATATLDRQGGMLLSMIYIVGGGVFGTIAGFLLMVCSQMAVHVPIFRNFPVESNECTTAANAAQRQGSTASNRRAEVGTKIH